MASDVLSALWKLEKTEKCFDIVFMDPPYNKGLEIEALRYLSSSHLIHEDSIIITEASLKTSYEKEEIGNLEIARIKEYKTNKHVFFKKT